MADRTTASITVAAPRADVMAVIADFAAYPEWASVDVRVPMPGMLKRRAEKTIIDTALKGLRHRAEAGRGDGT